MSSVLNVQLEWQRSVFGTGIGSAGMEIGDINGDGTMEIVAAASKGDFWANRFWYVVNRTPAGGYDHTYVGSFLPNDITCLRLFDYNNDGRPDIVVAAGSTIYVYDGPTKVQLAQIATSAATIRGLSFESVQDSLTPEFVFVDDNALYIYSAAGALLQKVLGKGGNDVAVGNVLADRTPEIVITNSTGGYVLHGRTRAVIESFPQGFGAKIRLCDTNGDSVMEVIAAQSWNYISCYMIGVSRTAIWQSNFTHDIGAVRVADIEGDGKDDILVGEGQWGDIVALNALNGARKWTYPNIEHGTTNIAVGNLDADGAKEIVHGAGFSSTGEDHLYVYDAQTRTMEWQSYDIGGPFYGLDNGDFDADGAPEFLYAAFVTNSGYDDGVWFTHNAITKNLETTGPPTNTSFSGLWRVKCANVDADPQMEIFFTASSGYDGYISCVDGLTHVEQFRTASQNGEATHTLAIADVDNDGQLEIVTSTKKEHTGATGTYIYVFNASTGALEWKSTTFGAAWGQLDFLRVANVDADANPEIICADNEGAFVVYDGVTKFGQAITGDLDITATAIADVDGNGVQDIVIGDINGNITVRDPFTGNVVSSLGNYGGRIEGLQVKNVAGSSAPDLIFCRNGVLTIVYKDLSNITQTSQTSGLFSGAGALDSLLVGDIDGDGRQEIMVGEPVGMRIYEITP